MGDYLRARSQGAALPYLDLVSAPLPKLHHRGKNLSPVVWLGPNVASKYPRAFSFTPEIP